MQDVNEYRAVKYRHDRCRVVRKLETREKRKEVVSPRLLWLRPGKSTREFRRRYFFYHCPVAFSKHEVRLVKSAPCALFYLVGAHPSQDPIPNLPTYYHSLQLRPYTLPRRQISHVPVFPRLTSLLLGLISILISLESMVSPCEVARKESYVVRHYRQQRILGVVRSGILGLR